MEFRQARNAFDTLKTLVAHPGTQHSQHLARELESRGLLSEYWTGLAFAEHSIGANFSNLLRFVPGFAGLGSRIVQGLPRRKLRTTPTIELRALWRLKNGASPLDTVHARNAAFQSRIPEQSLASCEAAIGFDTSSWSLAERCRARGKKFYLDRTAVHPAACERLMQKLAGQFPNWAGPTTRSRPRALIEAENTEHTAAYKIVVGGSFARQTLLDEGIPSERIAINPYGVDWMRFDSSENSPSSPRPLRFLFVGSVTAHKGIPVLLEAWRALAPREAELWIAGSIGARERALLPELPGLRFLGQIPRAQIGSLYRNCDVFVLPSLFEGFGLVILEALAAGLPVISTPNTGAVDALIDPALGEIVPVLSVEALVEAMRRQLNQPPDRKYVAAAALPLREKYSWAAYGDRWAALLTEN